MLSCLLLYLSIPLQLEALSDRLLSVFKEAHFDLGKLLATKGRDAVSSLIREWLAASMVVGHHSFDLGTCPEQ